MFRRSVKWRQIDNQEEITTARFIIQINEICDSIFEASNDENANANIKPAPKQRKMSDDEEIVLSVEDQNLFVEHVVFYTADKMKKSKRWSEGLLWYDSGTCSIFDEDGKLMYKYQQSACFLIPYILKD